MVHRLFPSPVEGESLFARAGAVPGAGSSVDAAALRRNVRILVAAAGGEVFVSKRIMHNRRVPELRRAFPDARFVHLVRDGRDVAASLQRVNWWTAERLWWSDGARVSDWLARGADPSELAARHWLSEVAAARQGLAEVEPSLVRTVRYEDLVETGLTMVEDLVRFAGLEPTERWRSEARAVLAARRRAAPSPAPPIAPVLLEVQGPELLRLGYDL